jgi:hypothetical protein
MEILYAEFYKLSDHMFLSEWVLAATNVSMLNVTVHYSFIHSFSSLSYDRSKASSKPNSPHSAI